MNEHAHRKSKERPLKMKRLTIAAFALAAMTFFSAPTQAVEPTQERVDSILVSVNGEPITLLDVVLETGMAERELAGIYTGDRLLAMTQKLRKDAIEQIITRKLVYEKYKENPFDIPTQAIEDLLDDFVKSAGEETRASWERRMAEEGVSPDVLRQKAKERIAVEAILAQVCDREVYVTPKEVYEEYQAHPEEWSYPETVTLQILQINRNGGRAGGDARGAAANIAKELEGTDPSVFTKLVLEKSDGKTADNGGIAQPIEMNKLRPEFIEALQGKAASEIVGPVETPEAFFFLRVLGIEPAKRAPFNEVSETIRKRLMSDAIRKRRVQYAEDLRKRAVIRYFYF